MAVHVNSKIITEGLKFYIDAGNPACFESGDTTCTNLVTGGLVTGASGTPNTGVHTPNTANFPAYSSTVGGCWTWSDTKGMNIEEELGVVTDLTISTWLYKSGSGAHQYIVDFRNDSGAYLYTNNTIYNITSNAVCSYNFSGSYDASDPAFVDRWLNIVVTSNASTTNLYVNGVAVTLSVTGVFNKNLGINARIGTRYTTATGLAGYIASVALYDNYLSAADVAANFQSMRKRFGV